MENERRKEDTGTQLEREKYGEEGKGRRER